MNTIGYTGNTPLIEIYAYGVVVMYEGDNLSYQALKQWISDTLPARIPNEETIRELSEVDVSKDFFLFYHARPESAFERLMKGFVIKHRLV